MLNSSEIEKISPSESSDEIECKTCGEMVRNGLVRCWNCGAFMKEEIANAYKEMKSRPSEIIYSPQQEESDDQHYDTQVEEIDEEGFELADDVFQSIPAEAIPSQELELDQPEPEPAPQEPQQPVAEQAPPPAAPPSQEEQVPHSEATGGEALLNLAREEEKETGRRRRMLPPGMFLVFCPNGHRIKVQEKHRGHQGKCPVCKTTFFVPQKPVEKPVTNENEEGEEENEPKILVTGAYSHWMEDISRHQVDLSRLKLRPGSLQKDFTEVEIAFSESGVLFNVLVKPGSLFGSANKKKPQIREGLHQALIDGETLDKLPTHEHHFLGKENLTEMAIVQPTLEGDPSLFHDIPIFGEGRIAIQLPKTAEKTDLEFLSLSLSQFRFFVSALSEVCGIDDFYNGTEIPLVEQYESFDCYYNDSRVHALNDMLYYKSDETFEFETTGYQCSSCGLVMSVAGREAASFGGAKGKSIAKTKCPGCDEKFGNLVLEAIKEDPVLAPVEEEEALTEGSEDGAVSMEG